MGADTNWLLIVPAADRFGGLMARLRFRQSKRRPGEWWRKFEPTTQARRSARDTIAKIRDAGLTYRWVEVAAARADVRVIRSETAKEVRLAKDALKRAREMRRQAEIRAARDADSEAKNALRRASGDRPGDYSRRREPPAP